MCQQFVRICLCIFSQTNFISTLLLLKVLFNTIFFKLLNCLTELWSLLHFLAADVFTPSFTEHFVAGKE